MVVTKPNNACISSGGLLPLERRLLPVAEVPGQVPPGDPAAGHGRVPIRHDEEVGVGEVHGGGDDLQEAQIGAGATDGSGRTRQDGQGRDLKKICVNEAKTQDHLQGDTSDC